MEFLVAKAWYKKAFFLPTSRFWTGFPPVSIEMAVFTGDGEIELNGEQSAGIFIQYVVMRSDACKWVWEWMTAG